MPITLSLPITALYTGLSLLLMIALAANVVRARIRSGVSLGEGNDKGLLRAIRAHGNAAEYIPLAIIALAVLEITGASALALHVYGSVFFIARILHVLGINAERSVNHLRKSGIIGSWLVMLSMAVHLLASTFTANPILS